MSYSMGEFLGSCVVGAICAGAIWFSHVIFPADLGIPAELIQLGGTGGLILSLLSAVVTLWRDRKAMQETLANERMAHRAEIEKMEEVSQLRTKELTSSLMDELRAQISHLKQDTADRYQEKSHD